MARHHIDKYVISFSAKNISAAANISFTISIILVVLVSASYGGHSINSKAIQPNADTIFYRIDTTIKRLEQEFWSRSLQFLREKKRKLKRSICYIIVDETHDSYTGKLLKKEKKGTLTKKERWIVKYIHKYKPEKGDTGSFKYLVFALVYGNKRRVLRVKAVRRKEKCKSFIIQTLLELKKEVKFECVLFDRGFYDGSFVGDLKRYGISFILRARISKTMIKIFGFSRKWKCYRDFEIGNTGTGNLILGIDHTDGKRTKWAFITNMEFENWHNVREIYRKRWNIENVFKATDGIQLRAQTSNPTTRLFCVCLSFLFYNAWQNKNKRNTLLNFIMRLLENLFDFVSRTVECYRDKLKINLPFWDKIVSSG